MKRLNFLPLGLFPGLLMVLFLSSASLPSYVQDTTAINRQLDSARVYRRDIGKAIPELKKALSLARKEQDDRLQARVLVTMGKVFQANNMQRQADSVFVMARGILYHLPKNKDYLYLLKSLAISNYYLNNNQKVLQYTMEGLKVATDLDNTLLQGTFNNISGIAESSLGNDAKALDYYLKALELFTKLQDQKKIATVDINIGNIYLDQRDDDSAKKYYLMALSIANKIKDTSIFSAIYDNLGNIASDRRKYKTALGYFQKSVELSKRTDDQYSVEYDVDNIGDIYKNLGDTVKEFQSYRQALEMARKNQDVATMTLSLENLAEYYESQKKLPEAISYAQKSLVYAKKAGDVNAILTALKLLNSSYAGKGNYKEAYHFLNAYNKLNDSVFSQKKASRLMKVEEAWRSKAKARELELAKETKKKVEASLIIFILSALLAVVILLFWLRQRGIKGKEVQRQKMFLDALLEEAESHVLINDANGHNTYLSPSYLKAFQRDLSERLGASAFDYVHPDDVPHMRKLMDEMKQGKKNRQDLLFRLQNKEGEYRTMRGVAKRLVDNENSMLKGAIVNFWDVTEIQKSQQALKESEEKFRNIFNAFPDIYFKIDIDGTLTDVSPSVKRITGFEPDEVIGKSVSSFIQLSNDWEQIRQKLMKRLKIEDLNLSLLPKKKVKLDCSLNAQAIKDADGTIIGFEGTLRDITKRVKAKAALKRSQRKLKIANDSKDKLLSIIGHDLRGAVGTQKAFLSMISKDLSTLSREEISDIIRAIKNSVDSSYTLVGNLLSWANIMRENIVPRFKNNRIYPVVMDSMTVLEEQAKSKNIALIYEGKKDVVASFDPDLMNIVFRNLISNAVKFSNPGSEVKISVMSETEYVQVSVEDHGVGMSKEDIGRVLSKSISLVSRPGTHNEKGTGLGLIVVREFINMNKGKLTIESREGEGTRFIIQFPGNIKSQI